MRWFALLLLISILFAPSVASAEPTPVAPSPTPPPIGIGAGLRQDPQTKIIEITMLIPDAPAERGGLQTGDILLGVDGISVVGEPLPETIDLIKGDLGTSVTLTVERPGQPAPIEITLIREMFVVQSP